MTPVKVSIIMPCYNERMHLGKTIDSVKAQTFTKWELLVIDDGSTDDSFACVNSLSQQDRRIRALKDDVGKGVASALNCGIAHSRGSYIARWDADDECHPTRLEKMVAYLDKHPEIGIVGCGVEKRTFSNGIFIHKEIFTYPDDHQILIESLARLVAVGANCMCRREVYEQVGGYDELLGGEEELDFLIRAAEHWKLGYIPEPLYIYNVIEGKGRSLKGRMKKKLIMAKLNIRAIRQFHLSPINFIYPLTWLFYSFLPLSFKQFIRRIYSKKMWRLQ